MSPSEQQEYYDEREPLIEDEELDSERQVRVQGEPLVSHVEQREAEKESVLEAEIETPRSPVKAEAALESYAEQEKPVELKRESVYDEYARQQRVGEEGKEYLKKDFELIDQVFEVFY